jgi:hypothetical protein
MFTDLTMREADTLSAKLGRALDSIELDGYLRPSNLSRDAYDAIWAELASLRGEATDQAIRIWRGQG